jgi:hypothetical protein
VAPLLPNTAGILNCTTVTQIRHMWTPASGRCGLGITCVRHTWGTSHLLLFSCQLGVEAKYVPVQASTMPSVYT